MKVGIMTWFQYHNYGTALQAYALNHVCNDFGCEPYIINYFANPNLPQYNNLKKIKSKIFNYINKNIYDNQDRIEKFENFYNDNLIFSNLCSYKSELEDLNCDTDAFICGSDQIWSPLYFDPNYFLDFVKDSNRIIAYAPSFGVSSIDDKLVESKIKNLLERFKYLSVREQSGADIISKLTKKQAEVVLDPTLLLSVKEWEKLISPVKRDQKYALVYMLGKNERHWKIIRDFAKQLNLDLRIIPVYELDYQRKGCLQKPIGPCEFLSLVNESEFIFTDSFHGTVFSIVFNKQFCTFKRFKANSKDNQNSRIFNLLKLFNLSDRIYSENNNRDTFTNIIDYSKINSRLQELKNSSIHFLKNSLLDVEKYIKNGSPKKNNIRKTHSLCCGCGACINVCPTHAIVMEMASDGFKKAFINDAKCLSCGLCRKTCPFINSQGILIKNHNLYSYRDSRLSVLLKSSSGGASFALSEIAIDNGYKIIGCEIDRTQTARHICIKTKSDLSKIQGSKYLQSDMKLIFAERNKKEKLFFIGLPCQISAARKIYGSNAVYIDLICQGVPSYNLFFKYKDYLKEKYHMSIDNMSIIFRYKEKECADKFIHIESQGKEITLHAKKDLFYRAFENSMCLGEQCYECPWRNKSNADIRIGDFCKEKFKNGEFGINILITLTETGEKWISQLIKSRKGAILLENEIDYFSTPKTMNMKKPLAREMFLQDLCRNDSSLTKLIRTYIRPIEKEIAIKQILQPIKIIAKRILK